MPGIVATAVAGVIGCVVGGVTIVSIVSSQTTPGDSPVDSTTAEVVYGQSS